MNNTNSMDSNTLISFPCEFPIKAMGLATESLEQQLFEIVRRHDNRLQSNHLSIRQSRNQKYISVTIRVWAVNQQQLDDIYQDITALDAVLYAL